MRGPPTMYLPIFALAPTSGAIASRELSARTRRRFGLSIPRSLIEKTEYVERQFLGSVRSFATQRADLLADLQPLPRLNWSRVATVMGAGRPLESTVTPYAQRLARHEAQHVKQIAWVFKDIVERPGRRRGMELFGARLGYGAPFVASVPHRSVDPFS
jgi:hypothetical protein